MNTLPTELIDKILDFLPEQFDLKSCALTSLVFRVPAQRRIFHRCYAESTKHNILLYDILLQSPHIGEYIRYPSFKIVNIHDAEAVSAILPFLTRVFRLVLICGYSVWSKKHPHELCDILYKSVVSLIQEKSLVTLWLENCSFANADLQDLFANTSVLEDLYITDKFTCRPFDTRPLIKASNKVKIKTLTIAITIESSLLVEWLCDPLCSVDPSAISYLRIDYDPDYNNHIVNLISRLLNLIGSSVADVIVRRSKYDKSRQIAGVPFDFRHNTKIRRLVLALTPYVQWEPIQCPPVWVDRSILRLAKPSYIEELVFEFEVENSSPEVILITPLDRQHTGWARIAGLLTRESFPALRTVTVTTSLPWNRLIKLQEIARLQTRNMKIQWLFLVSDVYHRPLLGRNELDQDNRLDII